MYEEMRVKRTTIIMLAAFFAFILAGGILVMVLVSNNSPEKKATKTMKIAEDFFYNQEYLDAIENYEIVIEIQEENTLAYRRVIECYAALEDYDALQEYYEEVLRIIEDYDSKIVRRDVNDIVGIYCMADRVYPKDKDIVIEILKDGCELTGDNAIITAKYDSLTLTMEEFLELKATFDDYTSDMMQKMMIEIGEMCTSTLLDMYSEDDIIGFLFVVNSEMITKEEYQRMVDNGIIGDDLEEIVADYEDKVTEIAYLNMLYAILEDEMNDSLTLNCLIDSKMAYEGYSTSELCTTYSSGLQEYYVTLINHLNDGGEMLYESAKKDASVSDIIIKQCYHITTLLVLSNYDYTDEAYGHAYTIYEEENEIIEQYLYDKYED